MYVIMSFVIICDDMRNDEVCQADAPRDPEQYRAQP